MYELALDRILLSFQAAATNGSGPTQCAAVSEDPCGASVMCAAPRNVRHRRLSGTVSASHLLGHTLSGKAIVIDTSLYMSVYAGSFDAVLNWVLCCHRPLWVCFNACWKSLYSDWVTAGSAACAPPRVRPYKSLTTPEGPPRVCTPTCALSYRPPSRRRLPRAAARRARRMGFGAHSPRTPFSATCARKTNMI